jgi:hypothetical protein
MFKIHQKNKNRCPKVINTKARSRREQTTVADKSLNFLAITLKVF